METPENQIARERLFAFAHGIRVALESLGMPFDGKSMQPILKRMGRILADGKNSLVRADDTVEDWKQFRRLREIEAQLCSEYLQEIAEASGVQPDGQSS